MKVVVCKNCGAKYQLDDADDINAFECSICTGSLEELEGSNKSNSQSSDYNYENSSNQNYESDSVIVCCQNCGLKFKLDKSDDIRDFECVGCDGSLRYLDNNLNELYGLSPLSEIVQDQSHEVEIIDENESLNSSIFDKSQSVESFNDEIVVEHDVVPESVDEIVVEHDVVPESVDEIVVEHDVVPESDVIDVEQESVEDEIIETEVEAIDDSNHEVEVIESEHEIIIPEHNVEDNANDMDAVEDNIIEREIEPNLNKKPSSQEDPIIIPNGPLTFNSIEEYEAYKLAIFKTYNALNESLKKEYILDLDKQVSSNRSKEVLPKKSASEPVPKMDYGGISYDSVVKSRGESSSKMYLLPLAIGIILIVAGIILFILTKQMFSLIILVLGILLLIFGIVSSFDRNGREIRTRIIREKLEELPEDFYLFYFTKPPYAKDGLNHVIVGPTGIYTILTQKYSSKEDKNKQKSDAENDGLIAGPPDIKNYMDSRNQLELTDGYDDNQTRFQFGNEEIQFNHNNRIKHKSLTLNEDLAIFLDKSGISGVYIEPLIGFINEDVAIINVVLTNEDLFLDELLNKIANGPQRLDHWTVVRIAALLSKYSVNCAMEP